MEFNSEIISYQDLLHLFWNSHTPTRKGWSRQYQAFVFYHNPAQKATASQSKLDLEAELGKKIKTEIRPYDRFYTAEDYHQKYYLQNNSTFMNPLKKRYPDMNTFINSTAAARINGYLGGYGTYEQFQAEKQHLGLPDEVLGSLEKRVRQNASPVQCES